MPAVRRLVSVSAWLLALALPLGCGEEGESDGEGERAEVLEFIAEEGEIVEGERTRLRWRTRQAVSVALLENGIKVGALEAEGSLEVSPKRDTTYRLEATGLAGPVVVREVTVSVAPRGAPVIEQFEVWPAAVRWGQFVTLSWRVQGASSIEIVDARGLEVDVPQVAQGSLEVRATASTTYELRATNSSGTITAEVQVVLADAPRVTLEASALHVGYEEEITLDWTVTDATKLVLYDPEDRVLHEGPGKDGSIALVGRVSGVYRAVAFGTGGEAVAKVHLTVEPAIVEFSATVQGSARPGSVALVKWDVRGADRIVVLSGGKVIQETSRREGEISAPVGEAGDFVLRAYSGSSMTEAHASFFVQERPLIRQLTTGPRVVAGQGVAGMSTIAWVVDGAAKLILEVEPGGLVDLTEKNPRADEVQVVFHGPGTVTLRAFNHAGEESMTIDAPVDPLPSTFAGEDR